MSVLVSRGWGCGAMGPARFGWRPGSWSCGSRRLRRRPIQALDQSFPNPFNSSTHIGLECHRWAQSRLRPQSAGAGGPPAGFRISAGRRGRHVGWPNEDRWVHIGENSYRAEIGMEGLAFSGRRCGSDGALLGPQHIQQQSVADTPGGHGQPRLGEDVEEGPQDEGAGTDDVSPLVAHLRHRPDLLVA